MTTRGDPPGPGNGDYVVPLPRITDALGGSLRRVYAVPVGGEGFAVLLRRLDRLH